MGLLSSSASPFPTHSLWLWMINRSSYRNRNIQYLCWHDANERAHELLNCWIGWTKRLWCGKHLTRQPFYHARNLYAHEASLNHIPAQILSQTKRTNLIFNQAAERNIPYNCFEVFVFLVFVGTKISNFLIFDEVDAKCFSTIHWTMNMCCDGR